MLALMIIIIHSFRVGRVWATPSGADCSRCDSKALQPFLRLQAPCSILGADGSVFAVIIVVNTGLVQIGSRARTCTGHSAACRLTQSRSLSPSRTSVDGTGCVPGNGLQKEGGLDGCFQLSLGSAVRWHTCFRPLVEKGSHLRISCLEMLAVWLGLNTFVPDLRGHHVLFRSDSMMTGPPLSGEQNNMAPPVCMLRWPHQGLPVMKQSLSKWLVDAIMLAYSSLCLTCPMEVRAHSTRGVASSWAWFSCVFIAVICAAAGWASPFTFARFYNMDVPGLQARASSEAVEIPWDEYLGWADRCEFGPIVSCGFPCKILSPYEPLCPMEKQNIMGRVARDQAVLPEEKSVSQHQGHAVIPTCLGHVEEALVPVSGPDARRSLSPCNGCVSHRLGSGHEWPPCPWSVVWLPSHVAHQLPGDAGRVSGKHFLPDLIDHDVLVCTHNTALVYHVNHQGDLRSRPLYKLAHQILVWSQDKLLSLRAVHVPGHLIMGADILSRQGPRPGEWILHPEMVKQVWRVFSQAQVDLFATQKTSQCPLWFSLTHPAPPTPLWVAPQWVGTPWLHVSSVVR
ncbi:Replication factor C small subunit [Labeo rohita]|uniref:Replication factor C small subunit n=1 Tax=Labeo rohita TaxID=84645 RepID=A0ABQ8MJI3_LABRO|nr:Replication factor C small subunit [Labeo rohita]